ncbi:hypothetical protein FACS1894139_10310 [Planctomycetales bacterium]|nr:hypothetical protein FACS1894108_04830 [Planctomycetales bacterium]GHT05808.1 hypothetical protein FACS1894139_10310 [Planctomycetales bacterium]
MRKKNATDDNLDMLLDAMCNALGAVVFIALLLGVMAFTQSSSENASTPPVAPTDIEAQIAVTDAELTQTQAALATLNISNQITGDTQRLQAEKQAQWQVLTAQIARLRAEKITTERQIATLTAGAQNDAKSRAATIAELTAEQQKLAAEFAAKSRQLSLPSPAAGINELPIEKKRVVIPTLRYTKMQPLYVIVRGGQLFPVWKINANGKRELNEQAYKITDSFARAICEPRNGRGVAVGTADQPSAGLKDFAAQLRRSGMYADFGLCPDSVVEFGIARDYLKENDLEYNWKPWRNDQSLVLVNGTPQGEIQ